MVAALYVERGGAYWGLDDVDPWDEARDARLYDGPHPVVAHPPCERWINLGKLNYSRWGGEHNRPGNDGGCFSAAVAAVRRWGGVLEHPAYSAAWPAFSLPAPHVSGGWQRGICGGWACHVEQFRYGHPARKATWLYAYGCMPPDLRWGVTPDGVPTALVSWCGNHVQDGESRPRVGKKRAAETPTEFRDVLLSIARSIARSAREGR